MQVQAYDAIRHIKNSAELPPFILVFGDEPQQKLDIIDAVRAKAKDSGFDERQNFTLDSEFEWSHLSDAMQSMSLFADKQYIELSMNSIKPGTQGAKQFVEIANLDNPDVVLLIQGPKAGKDVQRTKWFSALEKRAWFTHVYELANNQLVNWLNTRAQQIGLNISSDALGMVADLCEGNLMAGRQELEKLDLQFSAEQCIEAKDITRVMVQQSRYTSFQFTEEVLKGDMRKAISVLARLENEGSEAVVILWSLVNEAQTLSKLAHMQQQKGSIDFRALRIWPNKQGLYVNALSRLQPKQIAKINTQLSHADVLFKSTSIAKPFVLLSHLALMFMPADIQYFDLDKLDFGNYGS